MSNAEFLNSFIQRYPQKVLSTLLMDHTTGHNIIWADASYAAYGKGFGFNDPITLTPLLNRVTHQFTGIIQPRAFKTENNQSKRTRQHAEVFTPSWLANRMNNTLDREWFGRSDVFNMETENGRNWTETTKPITFPESASKDWTAYITSPRLEITCGEAPFLCSRYDTTTGTPITVPRRIGILDRKLRVASEYAKTNEEWDRWALKALQSTYGYEYQGDNLLIARINMLETLSEHRQKRWGTKLSKAVVNKAARIISWNLWQMDGLTDTVPSNQLVKPELKKPATLFDTFQLDEASSGSKENDLGPQLSRIYDWQKNTMTTFQSLKRQGGKEAMKKFYAVIGNPPYQETVENTSDKPIYNYFMDATYEVGSHVELVTPGRFLFEGGKTPTAWNKKMLTDEHLKVLSYESDSTKVFANTEIKGGVAVTYRDSGKKVGPIGAYSPYTQIRSVIAKIRPNLKNGSLTDVIYLQNRFNLKSLYSDYPQARSLVSSRGKERRIVTSSFNKLPCFFDKQTDHEQIRIFGLTAGNKRSFKWINSKYIEDNGNLSCYKVVVPKANGSGVFGETLSSPLILEPSVGYTQSFIAIGSTSDKNEAQAILKYIKTKFVRTMLDVKKITQDNPPEKWHLVPLQDFTSNSDIDWSQSVHDIDQQLYRKYGLTDEEQKFIESHVKEMD